MALAAVATVGPVSLIDHVPHSWRAFINTDALERVEAFLTAEEAAGRPWHPRPERIFAALTHFEPTQTRVVILGQDPYPRAGQPTGLAFDLPDGHMSPSARNILAEIATDLDRPAETTANFGTWAKQGVLLWNSAATTQVGVAGAHARCGWHDITRDLLAGVVAARPGVIFVCWGNHAHALAAPLEVAGVRIVRSNHPSPLSARRGPRPFIGSRPFSAVNDLLTSAGDAPIRWTSDITP